MIFDSHAHYDAEAFDKDREELLGGLADAGVGTVEISIYIWRGRRASGRSGRAERKNLWMAERAVRTEKDCGSRRDRTGLLLG